HAPIALCICRRNERKQEIARLSGCQWADVAVPAEFDAYGSTIADFRKRGDYRREIDLALRKHQMFVDALAHILDVNVHQPVAPMTDLIGNRNFALAMQVADIQRQTERPSV